MTDLTSSLPVLIVFGLFLVLFGSAAVAGLKAAPWVPTRDKDVDRMLRFALVKPGELVVDLGAGDGRFLLAAVQRFNARGLGYECSIGPWLAAQIRLRLARVRGQASVRFKDFFSQSLAPADVVTCFLTPGAMRKLEPKFLAEAKPGCRFVSYAFRFPNLEPDAIDKPAGRGSVFLYVKK